MSRFAAFVFCFASCGSAMAWNGDQAEIAARYKVVDAAYRTRRFDKLNAILADDAVIVAKNGRRTPFRAAIPKMAKGWSGVVEGSIVGTPAKIVVKGSKATAYVVLRGRTLERQGDHLVTMSAYGRVVDGWVRTPRGWRLKESRSITGLMMVPVWVRKR